MAVSFIVWLDVAGGFIDDGLGDFAGADLGGECGAEEIALHVHVEAGGEGFAGGSIGDAGRAKLLELMWRPDRDAESLREFMTRNF